MKKKVAKALEKSKKLEQEMLSEEDIEENQRSFEKEEKELKKIMK